MEEQTCMWEIAQRVRDGMASEDSCRAVEAHVEFCISCKAVFKAAPLLYKITQSQLRRKLRCWLVLFLFLGIFFGISIVQLSGTFSVVFLMPIAGMLAYGVYRWKALWIVPLLLLAMHGLAQILLFVWDVIGFHLLGCLLWAVLTLVFSDVGVLIAGLFHFEFRKERGENEEAPSA